MEEAVMVYSETEETHKNCLPRYMESQPRFNLETSWTWSSANHCTAVFGDD